MYSEQDLYKFLERIAISLERLAASPVTGYPPSTQATTPPKTTKVPLAPHVVSIGGAKTESTSASPAPAPLKPPTDKLQ